MQFQIVRDHYLLYETIELLYRFVNGISYRSMLSMRIVAESASESELAVRQAEELQSVLEETCQGLSAQDPRLLRFFGKIAAGDKQEGTCLARLLVFSFFTLKKPDLWENVEEIKKNWRYLQQKGAWIQDYSIMGLNFTFGGCCPGDFFEQVCALKLPADFQINLCRALRSFEQTLDELAALIAPVAERLGKIIEKWRKSLDDRASYWEKSAVSPLEYLENAVGQTLFDREKDQATVAIFAMNQNFLMFKQSDTEENRSYVYLGNGASVERRPRDQNVVYETFSQALKALSDRKRLEILGRLCKGRAYSLELSEAVGMDPSNMSRSLTLLCSYGFLRQTKEGQKNYYEADREALVNFLRRLETVLLD